MTDDEFKVILKQFIVASQEWLDSGPQPPPPPPPDVELGKCRADVEVEDGERLSGTVTIEPKLLPRPPTDVPARLIVDGVPMHSFTIDTTQWDDGTHVLDVQAKGLSVQDGTRMVVFNNSVPVGRTVTARLRSN